MKPTRADHIKATKRKQFIVGLTACALIAFPFIWVLCSYCEEIRVLFEDGIWKMLASLGSLSLGLVLLLTGKDE